MLAGPFACFSLPSAQAARIAPAKDSADINALYQQAHAAYVAADYPRALELLNRVDEMKPDQPDALNLRGIVCLRQGAYPQAEQAFQRAVALDPNLWAAQFNLAEIPFRQKNFAQARARFERLANQTNRFKEKNQWELVQYKLVLSCLLSGDEAAARQRFEKLTPAGPTPASLYAQAAFAFVHKDMVAANKSLTAAQSAYNANLNSLFSEPLMSVGWMMNPLTAGAQLAAAGLNSGFGNRLPPSASSYLDPRVEAAAAEPLPAPDGGILPMLPPALPESQVVQPTEIAPPAPTAAPRSGLDSGGLLLSQ